MALSASWDTIRWALEWSPVGQEGSDLRVRQGLQVGAVVQHLGDGGPRVLLALEFEDDQSTVFVDAQEVNESGLDPGSVGQPA